MTTIESSPGLFLTPVFYVALRNLEKRITGRVRPVNDSHGHTEPIDEPADAAAMEVAGVR